jgi:hypothetical protein
MVSSILRFPAEYRENEFASKRGGESVLLHKETWVEKADCIGRFSGRNHDRYPKEFVTR